MSNIIVKPEINQALVELAGIDTNDLAGGVDGGYAVLKFRSSKWRISYGGTTELITGNTGEPVPSLQVVLVRGSKALAKSYYASKYEEGSDDAPDCWSMDGVRPDPQVANPISPGCAACPMNAFGSRAINTPGGTGRGKACQDVRRIAVVPEGDLSNERYGGPMLLRVPPASLGDLAKFAKALAAENYPYNAVVTQLGFDAEASYPKLTFRAVRPLSQDHQDQLIELLQDPEFCGKVDHILNRNEEAPAAPAPAPAPAAPAPAARAQAAPAAPRAQAAPAAQPSLFDNAPVAPAKAAAGQPAGGLFEQAAPPAAAAQARAAPRRGRPPNPPKPAAAPPAPAPAAQPPMASDAGDDEPGEDAIDAILEGLGLSN